MIGFMPLLHHIICCPRRVSLPPKVTDRSVDSSYLSFPSFPPLLSTSTPAALLQTVPFSGASILPAPGELVGN
ncbi:hypothetical protein CBS147353_8215 [Aspergillus niger]|nr:hypothetical protein CBS147353_8215 [Aspergillus niger]